MQGWRLALLVGMVHLNVEAEEMEEVEAAAVAVAGEAIPAISTSKKISQDYVQEEVVAEVVVVAGMP